MKLCFFIFLCLGVAAFAEDEKYCKDIFNKDTIERLQKLNFFPDRELLIDVCPELIRYMECVERDELPEEEDDEKEFFLGRKEVILDVCTEDSRLQRAYLSSVACIRNELIGYRSCFDVGVDIYNEFRDFENNTRAEVSVSNKEHYCMIETFAVACFALDILEECGDVAHQTFIEMVQRSHMLKINCNPEDVLRMTSEFFDFLISNQQPNVELLRYLIERKK